MKKFIIVLSILLFIMSYCITNTLGQEKSIYYNIENLQSAEVKCDKKIVKCSKIIDGNTLRVDLKSVKPGKTKIKIIERNLTKDYGIVEVKSTLNVYVHPFGALTTGGYLGKCKGDISFLLSFYLIVLLIIIDLIIKYKKEEHKNLYSYRNVRILGLIIYILSQYIYSIFFFIYDYLAGYSVSMYGLIISIKENMSVLIILTFPLALLITILVTISNIKLMRREGKSLKNMLGILLGGTICSAIILNVLFFVMSRNNNVFYECISYLVFMYITYLECILLGTCILGFKSARKTPKFDKDYIIILGCKIKDDGTLPPLLKSRVDRAIEFSNMQKEATNKDIIFVPSGGKGNDEVISEAEAMKNYLLDQGISKKNIIVENKSKNTIENIKFSNKLIKEKNDKANVAFSTTNYHVFRAGIIATNQNLSMEGIGSKTRVYYWINAFIREFIATLVSEKKSHIKTIIVLTIILLINVLIAFLIRNI